MYQFVFDITDYVNSRFVYYHRAQKQRNQETLYQYSPMPIIEQSYREEILRSILGDYPQ